ncbi:hypothetical protein E8E13_011319 [Curvularia kusanoi]|uniref:Acetyl-CoA synthetase-like protein n=1 Tax=Curvularia kusanoi TaxID=90978 RepID=A0A9P4TM54_CURKU|nr:hypothetical protein E8E13_011319 [Curvularia kusanoi]
MPLLAQEHIPISNKDILSWMYDEPQFDHDTPIYIDANDASNNITASQAKLLIRRLVAGFQRLGHAFRSCAPKLVICDPDVLNTGFITAARSFGLPVSSIFVLDTPHFRSLHVSPGVVIESYFSWRNFLIHGEASWVRFDDEATSKRTVAVLFFSSGTTGLPKLTKLSHYNLVTQHTLVFEHFRRPYTLKRLIALPMFHAATAPSTHTSPLRSGHPQVIMRRYDPETFLRMCAKHQITDLTLVPPQVISLLAHPLPDAQKQQLLKSVKLAYGGAAPLDAVTQSKFQKLLPKGSPFTQVFGMTESSCFASILPYPEGDTTASVGRFLPTLDVKLLDDAGVEMQDYSQPGELALRGPTITEGYVGVPRERDFDAEGYFRTGDILYQDQDSQLWYIVDRKKELIKVNGFQVAPKELEGVLLEHTDIADVAVIGIKDAAGKEMPRAYVVTKEGAKLSESDVKLWVEDRLVRYKWLSGGVKFVTVIPKSPSGKILKRVLRDEAENEVRSKL